MIRRIKARIRKYKSDRFLKKHNCETWRQYNRLYDPDYNKDATKVTNYYKGYKYIHVFEDTKHYAYQTIYDYGPAGHRDGYFDILEWAEKNCKGKYRADMHRAIHIDRPNREWLIFNGSMIDYNSHFVYAPQNINIHYLFFAFKDEQDYTWFKLRWE